VAQGLVRIFDTTLRDGEQAPGAALNVAQKIELARALVRLKVDVIEAGFPASSPGEFEAVSAIARETREVSVAALARCRDGDPQRAIEAISAAQRPHLHLFIASSDIHLKHKLHLSREQALRAAEHWVRYGREALGPNVEIEFSAEDATRTDPDFLMKIFEAVLEAGASTLNIPDTVGYAIPSEFAALVARVVKRFGSDATISVHCHNDLGLAVANTLAAIAVGARQAEVCVNGLGERAGNAAIEEVAMAMATRPTMFPGLATRLATEQITPISRLVSYLTGFALAPNKAIVGANAFAHESGIHQDGVLKNPLTYEIMTPGSVGLAASRLSIGKLSGRAGLSAKLRELGYSLEGEALNSVYGAAIALADAKKEVSDEDLIALIEQGSEPEPDLLCLGRWEVSDNNFGQASGSLSLSVGDAVYSEQADGNGPVEALYGALDQVLLCALGWKPVLIAYEIKAVSSGEDAQGQVTVRLRRGDQEAGEAPIITAHGLSVDIIEASLRAYLAGAEKLIRTQARSS
jgi:2-isopropylmalate synthase